VGASKVIGSMSGPKVVGAWVRVQTSDPRGFGFVRVWTQVGLGVESASGPNEVGSMSGPKGVGTVHVRTQMGAVLGWTQEG
jgi:hypothetical protein